MNTKIKQEMCEKVTNVVDMTHYCLACTVGLFTTEGNEYGSSSVLLQANNAVAFFFCFQEFSVCITPDMQHEGS